MQSRSSKIDLSDGVLKGPIAFQSKCSYFVEKTMDYKWVKLSKLGCFENVELKMPSGRVCSGLSENHKIIPIGLSKLKLWQF